LKNRRFIGIGDSIVLGVNTLAVLVLLLLVLGDFIRSHEGSYMTWIQLQGYGEGWGTNFGIEIFPLMALAIIFLVTQIYLNLRLIQRASPEKEDNKDSARDTGSEAWFSTING
jgi:hypothetical protein